MSNEYGGNAPLSYNKYLRVRELIGLQDCLSDPVHHDELLFITIHQAYELWFKQMLHEIDAALARCAKTAPPRPRAPSRASSR
jgi:tryptophan 2,3-dioxygenase